MEEKVRFQVRYTRDTDRKMKAAMELDNCQSKNEFVERAVRFYSEYLNAKDNSQVLPPVLVNALRATIQNSEDRMARMLFKLAVEESVMAKVLSLAVRLDQEELDHIRAESVREVKRSNGMLSFKKEMENRWGDE